VRCPNLIKPILGSFAVLVFVAVLTVISVEATEQKAQVPVPGMVTMVDLGAKKCIPCKMMAPIMEELEKVYKDRAAIVFIDVWENPDAGRAFGIRSIPTQIFYDAHGKEVFRHEGFFDKASIVAELQKLGVK
jgi:thioredoxin 1